MRQRRWGRRGATQVMVAVSLPVVIGMGALSVDIGRLVVAKQHLQQICDAAARSGGAALPTDALGDGGAAAVQAATACAQANGAQLQPPPSATPPQGNGGWRLTVTATEDVPMAFARIWGITSRPVQAQAVAEREPAAGWVPLALVHARRWANLSTTYSQQITLAQCAADQWWVTAANRVPIDFATAFQQGANVGLHPNDQIQLARTASGSLLTSGGPATTLDGRPLPTATDVLNGLQRRVGQTVQVLLLDDSVKGPGGLDVTNEDKVASATFSQYATVQIVSVTPGQNLFEIQFVNTGTGSLNAGSVSSGGQVRLVQ